MFKTNMYYVRLCMVRTYDIHLYLGRICIKTYLYIILYVLHTEVQYVGCRNGMIVRLDETFRENFSLRATYWKVCQNGFNGIGRPFFHLCPIVRLKTFKKLS